MRRVSFSSTAPARSTSSALPAHHRHQRAGAHLRDGAEHRRLDQPRAARRGERRELAAGHRLQRAHLDEQLAADVGCEKARRAGEDLPHAVVVGDAGDDDVGCGGNAAGVGGDAQTAGRLRRVGGGALIPTEHIKALLAQPLRHRRAHAAETHNAEIHRLLPCHSACRQAL